MRSTLLIATLAWLPLAACDKNPIDVALDAALDFGEFIAPDGMVITVEGNQAAVKAFGASSLGTNPDVFGVGDAVLRNLKATATNGVFRGEVVAPTLEGGVVVSIDYTEGELRILGDDGLRITGASSIPTDWTRAPFTPTTTAECRAHWDPILLSGTPWEAISIVTPQGVERIGYTMEDVVYDFYPDSKARMSYVNAFTGGAHDSGVISYNHNFHFTSPLDGSPPWCRITGVGTWFPLSFKNGTLTTYDGNDIITLKAN